MEKSNYRMKWANAQRRYVDLNNPRKSFFLSKLISIDEARVSETHYCPYCGGKVSFHNGNRLDPHFEHTKGEGSRCLIHIQGFNESAFLYR